MIEPERQDGTLSQAMLRLNDEVRNGLKHGFFEVTITCEIIKNRERRLTIKAGKSHRFTISQHELLE